MKSSNVFPSARAYEMAAEEYEKNQELFESSGWNPKSKGLTSSEWETRLVNYGSSLESIREESHDYSNQEIVELQQDEPGGNNETEHEDSELMRQKWVDTAHLELSRTFKGNPQATEESRERSKDIVPLWLRRSLQRQGLI
uniref:DNA repair protein RAD5 n=1 Tax=Lygus hesperus TaxID=30085 RepID=A0A0A9WP83_LYGHE